MQAALIPARGFGDALIMMVAAYALKKAGYQVWIVHPLIHELADWFDEDFHFCSYAHFEENKHHFSKIIVQNDNSIKINNLKKWREENHISSLSIFYPTYQFDKHGPSTKQDFVFDKTIPMVHNMIQTISAFFGISVPSQIPFHPPKKENKHRKYNKRIVIQPTSYSKERTWKRSSFLFLYQQLKKRGYDPKICISSQESVDWQYLGIDILNFDTLSDFASFLYESALFIGNESGGSHLASMLDIPSVIIAQNRERMRLWQPGWKQARLYFPMKWLPNIKGLRLKDNKWQHFVGKRKVFKGCLAELSVTP